MFIETQTGRIFNAEEFERFEVEGNTIRAYFRSEEDRWIFLGAYGSEKNARKALKMLGQRLGAVNLHEYEDREEKSGGKGAK